MRFWKKLDTKITNTNIAAVCIGVGGVLIGVLFKLEPYEWKLWGSMLVAINIVSAANIWNRWNK